MKIIRTSKIKKGGIQIFPFFVILLLIMGVFILFLYENVIANNKYSNFKNGLDAANLSVAKNVNQMQLARSGELTFKESDLAASFETFKEYLVKNYYLDSKLKNIEGNNAVVGKVEILDLRLYSVEKGKITEWRYIPSQSSFVKAADNVTKATTPNHKPVQATSIYSEVKLDTFTVMKSNEKQTKTLKIKSYVDFINE